MRLPVEQYYELDPDLIVPRQGNRFGLMVPRVHVRPPDSRLFGCQICLPCSASWLVQSCS